MLTQLLLLLASLASLSLAALELGVCPEWTNKQDFEIPPYLGRWYEIERFEAGFQLDMTCVTADYGPLSDTMITVTNTANLLGQLVNIEGNATATENPGQLIVYFPGNDPGFYNVLDTNYESASCVYSCSQIGEYRQEYAWILSRTEELTEDAIANAEESFIRFNIDISKFTRTVQGEDCTYAPEPEYGLV